MLPYWFAFTLIVAVILEPWFLVAFPIYVLVWFAIAKWFDG